MAVVAATGFFDGVHSGHRAVLRRISEIAEEKGSESALVTFWPHPRHILKQDSTMLHLLNTLDEKTSLIKRCGIDYVHVIPFTKELSGMSARDFICEYLVGRYNVDTLVIGYDHRLGSDNLSGNELVEVARQCGLDVSVVAETEIGSSHVSSTVIRGLIEAGDFKKASLLLGYDWSVRFKDLSTGEKVLPSTGLYRVLFNDEVSSIETTCMVSGHDMRLTGLDRGVFADGVITFLERIS